MLHGIFDSHAHYDDRRYDADRTEVFRQIRKTACAILLNVGCDMESSQNSISFAEQYDFFHAAVGIHPEYAEEATAENLTRIEAMLLHEKVAALGEIGLDYHWDEPPRTYKGRRSRGSLNSRCGLIFRSLFTRATQRRTRCACLRSIAPRASCTVFPVRQRRQRRS